MEQNIERLKSVKIKIFFETERKGIRYGDIKRIITRNYDVGI